MENNTSVNGNPRRAFGIRQLAQSLFLMGNRIHLNGTQRLLLHAGHSAVTLAFFYLLVFYSAPVGVDTANSTHAFLLLLLFLSHLLFLTGSALLHFTDVVPGFPRAALVASRVAHKIYNIFLSGPA